MTWGSYCGWLRNLAPVVDGALVLYPILHRLSTIQAGAGVRNHPQSESSAFSRDPDGKLQLDVREDVLCPHWCP